MAESAVVTHVNSMYTRRGLGGACDSGRDRRSHQPGRRWRGGRCGRNRFPGDDSRLSRGHVEHGRGRWQLRRRPHGTQDW